jgi:hypothetical protein
VGAADSDSADDDDNTPEDELLLTVAVAVSESILYTQDVMRIRHRRWMMGIDQQ